MAPAAIVRLLRVELALVQRGFAEATNQLEAARKRKEATQRDERQGARADGEGVRPRRRAVALQKGVAGGTSTSDALECDDTRTDMDTQVPARYVPRTLPQRARQACPRPIGRAHALTTTPPPLLRGAQPTLVLDGVEIKNGPSGIRASDFLTLRPKTWLTSPIIDALLAQIQNHSSSRVLVMATTFSLLLFAAAGMERLFRHRAEGLPDQAGCRRNSPSWVKLAAAPHVFGENPLLFDRPAVWEYMFLPVACNATGAVAGASKAGDHWVFVLVDLVSGRLAYCDSWVSVRGPRARCHLAPFPQPST